MQFAVIARATDSSNIPLPAQLGMVKRTFEMFASKQDSRIVANYPFAGERGGLAIVEVNSGDELQELLGGLPFAPIVTLEIHAVGSIQASLKTVDQVQQQMANMIPAGVG